jgi:hypothetical protein
VGIASLVAAIVIFAALMVFIFAPGIAIYLPGTLVGIGSIIAVIFLAVGMLGKE